MIDKVTLPRLQNLKKQGEKFTCLTAYDASFARLLSTAGVEILLVGDTLGNVIQGHETTIPVSLDHMIYHTQCVSRGNLNSLIIADLSFMTYANSDQTLVNAAKLMQAGAHMVKLEGGMWLKETIVLLSERGIPTCAHLGLMPQSVHKYGGYRQQGKEPEHAQRILQEALALQQSGASLLVLEYIPSQLAREITEALDIPTIGIGSGPHCNAQVLVLYDILGISLNHCPRFAKNFMQEANNLTIQDAIKDYVLSVKQNKFPSLE